MVVGINSAEASATEDNSAVVLYKNPFRPDNDWYEYGVGDPYILRWNGRYYLYPSTSTHGSVAIGVKAWSSEDLIHWKYEGLVTNEAITRGAYAPEVVYWNGYFYMYTSPSGKGHYVLRSDSPTGPFTVQTGNLGLSIDGSVFIDDDGQWYFTHAGSRGIQGSKMPDPYSMGPDKMLNSDLGHWTEGSMIIKRNGYYYLTYTGNHVDSRGYRINYSVASDGPLGSYHIPNNNPIAISTKDEWSALGHSSSFIGPDLDSYYITYHDRLNWSGPLLRRMNIDRLVFNGAKMALLGPTNYTQKAPKLADFYTWLDELGTQEQWSEPKMPGFQLLVSKTATNTRYTAEFSFQVREHTNSDTALVGAVFSYQDPENLMYALVNTDNKVLSAYTRQAGIEKLLGEARLPDTFDFSKLHTLRVVAADHRVQLYFDSMLKLDMFHQNIRGGQIGYIYKNCLPIFRYTAFSNDAFGSSDFDTYKPVPGVIEAVHYINENGYYVSEPSQENPYRPSDTTAIALTDDGSYALQLLNSGDWLQYHINVKEAGLYAVDLMVKAPVADAELELWVDNVPQGTISVSPEQVGNENTWFKMRSGQVALEQGFHTLRLRLKQGKVQFKYLDFTRLPKQSYGIASTLTEGRVGTWKYIGAPAWSFTKSGYSITKAGDGMVFMGDDDWTDYGVQVSLNYTQLVGSEAGLFLRATNASYHPYQTADPVCGYYISLSSSRVALKKLNYGAKLLKQAIVNLVPQRDYQLKVEVKASTLKVYLEDMQEPILEYTDPDAYMHGAAGIRTNSPGVTFRNLSVRCATCRNYGSVKVAGNEFILDSLAHRYEVNLPYGTQGVPSIEVTPTKENTETPIRIEVVLPDSVPGQATIRLVNEHEALVHSVSLNLLEADPIVRAKFRGQSLPQDGWAGIVSGMVSYAFGTDSPAAVVKHMRVVLQTVNNDLVTPIGELYSGPYFPDTQQIDTLTLQDGTYELEAEFTMVTDVMVHTAIRFKVSNYTEFIDKLIPPTHMFFGELTTDKSPGWQSVIDNPDTFFGDTHRNTRIEPTTEYLVWEVPLLQRATFTVYAKQKNLAGTVALAVSNDMKTWVPLPYRVDIVETSPAGWLKLALVGEVAPVGDANYVRIMVMGGMVAPDEVQIGEVLLRSRVEAK